MFFKRNSINFSSFDESLKLKESFECNLIELSVDLSILSDEIITESEYLTIKSVKDSKSGEEYYSDPLQCHQIEFFLQFF